MVWREVIEDRGRLNADGAERVRDVVDILLARSLSGDLSANTGCIVGAETAVGDDEILPGMERDGVVERRQAEGERGLGMLVREGSTTEYGGRLEGFGGGDGLRGWCRSRRRAWRGGAGLGGECKKRRLWWRMSVEDTGSEDVQSV